MKVKLYLFTTLAVFALLLTVPQTACSSTMNLLQDSTVTLNGKFGGNNKSYINDGITATPGTQWSSKDYSVWWTGGGQSVEIQLAKKSRISSMSVQADNNDQYQVDYWDDASGSWQYAWTADKVGSSGNGWQGGLRTRDNSGLDISTDKLRVTAVSGDGHFSVSEVRASGAPTPAPPAMAVLLMGLAGLGLVRKKFFVRHK